LLCNSEVDNLGWRYLLITLGVLVSAFSVWVSPFFGWLHLDSYENESYQVQNYHTASVLIYLENHF
jgi:hypothetical protein